MRYVGLVLILLLFAGCDNNPAAPKPEGDWTHRYLAFDSTDHAFAFGYLRLTFSASDDELYPTRVSGAWHLRALGPGDLSDLQDGEGRLEGSIKADGELWFNFNPDLVDANMTFWGPCADSECSRVDGQWGYSTFVGGVDGGRAVVSRLQ